MARTKRRRFRTKIKSAINTFTRKKARGAKARYQKKLQKIQGQEQALQAKGFSTPSVMDVFDKNSYSKQNARELREYSKTWESYKKEIAARVREIQRQKNVSREVGYHYVASLENMRSAGTVSFEDVIFSAFFERTMHFPNANTRRDMVSFMDRLRKAVGDEEAARLLAESATNEQDFDSVLQYYPNEEAQQNTYALMQSIVDRLDETEYPITKEELTEWMESLL